MEPSVEPVAEFGQIAGKMFLTNRMIGTVKGILDIAQQGVDPEESGIPDAIRSSSCHLGPMGISCPIDSPESGQPVGNHRAVR